MRRRLFNLVSVVSLVLLVMTLALWVFSYWREAGIVHVAHLPEGSRVSWGACVWGRCTFSVSRYRGQTVTWGVMRDGYSASPLNAANNRRSGRLGTRSILAGMIPLTEQRRASRQLHAIAEKIDGFSREFHGEATRGTGIDLLVKAAKALLVQAAQRTPLMGVPAAEQTKLAKAPKLKMR